MNSLMRCEGRKFNVTLGDQLKEIYHYLSESWPDSSAARGGDLKALVELAK
jgi:hypothetical protein